MNSSVDFSDKPSGYKANSLIYDSIAEEFKNRPGEWGKCAEVVGVNAVNKWRAALKGRGLSFTAKTVRENTWAIWCMFPEES
jgi:hypothetical protein